MVVASMAPATPRRDISSANNTRRQRTECSGVVWIPRRPAHLHTCVWAQDRSCAGQRSNSTPTRLGTDGFRAGQRSNRSDAESQRRNARTADGTPNKRGWSAWNSALCFVRAELGGCCNGPHAALRRSRRVRTRLQYIKRAELAAEKAPGLRRLTLSLHTCHYPLKCHPYTRPRPRYAPCQDTCDCPSDGVDPVPPPLRPASSQTDRRLLVDLAAEDHGLIVAQHAQRVVTYLATETGGDRPRTPG